MKRTNPALLVLLGVLGAVAGWFLQTALLAAGRPLLVPPFTLGAALALIGVIVVALALPIWRFVRGTVKGKVDPFYATRVVVLAKASSLTGSLLGGATAAIVVFLLSRSVVPPLGSMAMAIASLVGSVVLLAGGLVAEKMCTLPPHEDGATRPGTDKDSE